MQFNNTNKELFLTNNMQYRQLSLFVIAILVIFVFPSNTMATESEWKIYRLIIDGQEFRIPYKITNAEIGEILKDPHSSTILVIMESEAESNGTIEISLPRELINSNIYDVELSVIIDSDETGLKEIKMTPCVRTVLVEFPEGSEQIEINAMGTLGSNPIQPAPPIYVTTDKNNYEFGETIIISGCTSLALDDKVVVGEVLSPEGSLYSSMIIEPHIDGSFSSAVGLEHLNAINGTYTGTVKYAGQTAATAFVIPEFPVSIMIASVAIGLMVGIMRLRNVKLFLH